MRGTPLAVFDGNPETEWTTDVGYWTIGTEPLEVSASSGVLENDIDPDGDSLHAVLEEGPLHGAVSLRDNGAFVYTAVPGFIGVDSFKYRALDGTAQSDITTVYVAVNTLIVEFEYAGPDGSEWKTPIVVPAVWAGERINVRRTIEGPVAPVAKTKWTVSGTSLTNYFANDQLAFTWALSEEDLTLSTLQFFWVSSGAQSAKVRVTIGEETLERAISFAVSKPTNSVSTITDEVRSFPGAFPGSTWVQFGNNKDPARIVTHKGIQFTRNGVEPDRPGTFQWVQLIETNMRRSAVGVEGGPHPYRLSSNGFILDSVYPYPSTSPTTTEDSPGSRMDSNWRSFERDDSFKMFLMWKSDKPNSKWVPICVTSWGWGVEASSETGAAWIVTPHAVAVDPASVPTNAYPEWVNNFENLSWEADD